MLAIAWVGAVAVVKNPGAAKNIPIEAATAVKEKPPLFVSGAISMCCWLCALITALALFG